MGRWIFPLHAMNHELTAHKHSGPLSPGSASAPGRLRLYFRLYIFSYFPYEPHEKHFKSYCNALLPRQSAEKRRPPLKPWKRWEVWAEFSCRVWVRFDPQARLSGPSFTAPSFNWDFHRQMSLKTMWGPSWVKVTKKRFVKTRKTRSCRVKSVRTPTGGAEVHLTLSS